MKGQIEIKSEHCARCIIIGYYYEPYDILGGRK